MDHPVRTRRSQRPAAIEPTHQLGVSDAAPGGGILKPIEGTGGVGEEQAPLPTGPPAQPLATQEERALLPQAQPPGWRVHRPAHSPPPVVTLSPAQGDIAALDPVG